ncbi:MAG: hypothetical protein ACYTG0_37655 [Planctomycetota bacterium]|jgi:hypothetical protein
MIPAPRYEIDRSNPVDPDELVERMTDLLMSIADANTPKDSTAGAVLADNGAEDEHD